MFTSKQRVCPRVLLILSILVSQSFGFYIPGLAPVSYKKGDNVDLSVNVLSPLGDKSRKMKSILTYSYYDSRLHFCEPDDGVKKVNENLGALLFGDRIFNSKFKLKMGENEECVPLCEAKVPGKDAEFINDLIMQNYGMDWLVDGLPVRHKDEINESGLHSVGFHLGENRQGISKLFHNHYDIEIEYHKAEALYRVVGAIVTPSSKDYGGVVDCKISKTLSLNTTSENKINYSYSVSWKEVDSKWATRWDVFLKINDSSIHWLSLIYSLVLGLLLTGILATVLLRILSKDIARYNQIDLQDDIQEDFGWKLVHGDVFRPPTHLMLLSVLAGSGLQLFGMVFTTLAFAGLGFFSPSMRGSFVTAMVVLFMLFGVVSGFTSARLYKMFGGDSWKSNILVTATLVPGSFFVIFVILDFFLIATNSSASVPFGTIFSIILLWFLLSTPLSFVGSYYGLKKSKITHPVRTNQIPRQVPDQPLSLHAISSVLVGGLLPFIAIYNEFSYIMDSLWFHQIYYLFGFLFVIFLSLCLISSELAILLCYLHLCSENYHWWWRSFFVSGSTSIYVTLYAIYYYFSYLELNFVSTMVYFGWVAITSLLCFLMTGSVGFLACLLFTRKIYGSIKID